MYNWSNPRFNSEVGDSATLTRGSVSAGRPWRSRSVTWCSSNQGTRPTVWAVIEPMRTVTPSRLLASRSMRGRKSSMRGTIQPCNPPQTRVNSSHASNTTHSIARTSIA